MREKERKRFYRPQRSAAQQIPVSPSPRYEREFLPTTEGSLVFPQIADQGIAGTVEPLLLSPASEVQKVKIDQHSQLTISRLAFQDRAQLLD